MMYYMLLLACLKTVLVFLHRECTTLVKVHKGVPNKKEFDAVASVYGLFTNTRAIGGNSYNVTIPVFMGARARAAHVKPRPHARVLTVLALTSHSLFRLRTHHTQSLSSPELTFLLPFINFKLKFSQTYKNKTFYHNDTE